MKRTLVSSITLGVMSLLISAPAWAHVIVTPNQVGISATQDFVTNVPSEKDSPTVQLRLVLPDGLGDVMPIVQAGWTIDEKKTGDGDDAKVTEITWSGGQIPSGTRAEFSFNAQAPDHATTLQWKAYQTYADGTVVSWDQTPIAGREEDDSLTPYSQTKVIDDLTPAKTSVWDNTHWAFGVSVAALAIAALALVQSDNKRKKR